MKSQYLIVDYNVAPDVFKKVIETKGLIESGKYKTVKEALCKTNLSRTAFYKYRDYIFASDESSEKGIATVEFTLDDVTGILSEILKCLAKMGFSVLTINQNIPINGVANITISFRTDGFQSGIDAVINKLGRIDGVNKVHLLAMSV